MESGCLCLPVPPENVTVTYLYQLALSVLWWRETKTEGLGRFDVKQNMGTPKRNLGTVRHGRGSVMLWACFSSWNSLKRKEDFKLKHKWNWTAETENMTEPNVCRPSGSTLSLEVHKRPTEDHWANWTKTPPWSSSPMDFALIENLYGKLRRALSEKCYSRRFNYCPTGVKKKKGDSIEHHVTVIMLQTLSS